MWKYSGGTQSSGPPADSICQRAPGKHSALGTCCGAAHSQNAWVCIAAQQPGSWVPGPSLYLSCCVCKMGTMVLKDLHKGEMSEALEEYLAWL